MVFQTKKIQSETLSEYLSAVRNSLGLSLDFVSEQTSVPKKFIEMLESGNFSVLPAEVYTCGFLKKLATLYATEESVLVSQYRKERGMVVPVMAGAGRAWRFKNFFTVTPKTFSILVAAFFLFGTVLYVALQIKGMSQYPTIHVLEPAGNSLISESFVRVVGKTESGNQLNINNQDVFVSEQGDFTATISVASGPIELVFTVKNKFNRTTVKTLGLVRYPVPGKTSQTVIPLALD